MNTPRLPICLLGCLLPAGLTAQSHMSQLGEIVHASGMPMPGSNGASPNDFPPGAVMAVNGTAAIQPAIDQNGTMLYYAQAQSNAALGITPTNSRAFYLGHSNGDLRMILRQGDQAPGLPAGITVQAVPLAPLPFQSFRISPFGETLMFFTGLQDPVNPGNTPTNADTALFWGAAGALQPLAREGDPVPTVGGGAVYGSLPPTNSFDFHLIADGTAMFSNVMQTGIGGVTAANDGIVLVGTPGNLTTMLREGDPWPGAGATGELVDAYNTTSFEFPVRQSLMNESGQVLHDLHFRVPSGSATSTANDRALAIWNAGTDVIVVREGDQAPGMPAGAVFADLSPGGGFFTLPNGAFNRSGAFVFYSQFPVGPGGVTAADDQAMFVGTAGSLSMVFRKGDPAPATFGPGVLWGTTNIGTQMNDDGLLVFRTTLGGAVTAANDTALVIGTPGNLAILAREGDPAPGMPGFTFAEITGGFISLTNRGHVLFLTSVTDGTPQNAVFSYTPEQGVRLFFERVDSFTTLLGSSAQPVSFGSSGAAPSGDTGAIAMNNNGDVACRLSFTGTESTTIGCAIARGHVGSLPAIPAAVPSTGGLAQKFFVDCGPQHAFRFYFILATSLGTRPGFPSPLGPQTVPLNFDPLWTQLSFDAANSLIWSNTLGITDADGKGIGTAAFEMPTGQPGFAGTQLHHAAVLFDTSLQSVFVTEPAALRLY